MSDATILLRDIAGDAAQNAATRINPGDDALAQIDNPAEDNTWHDVPDLSPAALKSQARDQYQKNKPFSKTEAQDAAAQASHAATGTSDPQGAAMTAQEQGPNGVDARGGANVAASNLKAAASENVPEETKEQGRTVATKTKNYLSDKLPKERRENTVYRMKKMIVEIQSHSDCECPRPKMKSL